MARTSKYVVIVDDSYEVRYALHATLKYEGYLVVEATTGEELLDLLYGDEMPALILLDLQLPEMDGLEVMKRIAELPIHRQPTVIVLTEKGQREAAIKAVHLGAADFLEKPLVDKDVLMSIQIALSGPQPKKAPVPHTKSELLKVIRQDLSKKHYAHAHRVFEGAIGTLGGEAPYFNLMGVLAEVENNPKAAQAFYRKAAVWSGPSAKAAKHNLDRLVELEERGETGRELELGDEAHLLEDAMGKGSGSGFLAKFLGR